MNTSARTRNRSQQGFALITAMLLVAVLAVMVTAYFMLTQIEMTTASSSQNSTSGFYAAEAGLNIRGQELRNTFLGFNQPEGLSPENVSEEGKRACKAYTEDGVTEENLGADDFRCVFYEEENGNEIAEGRRVVTFVTEPGVAAGQQQTPLTRALTTGRFAGLNAQEFIYDVQSESYRVSDDEFPEAKLQTTFRSQVVPLFQFAAFYDQDLEISPGADMTLEGRVHSNGDLFLNGDTLTIDGNVTSAGGIFGGGRLPSKNCDKDVVIQGAKHRLQGRRGRRHQSRLHRRPARGSLAGPGGGAGRQCGAGS